MQSGQKTPATFLLYGITAHREKDKFRTAKGEYSTFLIKKTTQNAGGT